VLERFVMVLRIMVFCQCLTAQGISVPPGSAGVGNGAYRKDPDIYSGIENSAALALIPGGVGIYSERSFFLNPLQLFSIIAAMRALHGGVGFSVKYFGYQNYQESESGVTYARQLGPKVAIGAGFNCYLLSIPGYFSTATPSARFGVLCYPTDKFVAGLDIYNPVGGKFGRPANEKLASIIRFGLGYTFNPYFFLSTSVLKIEKQPAALLVGMDYIINQSFFLATGFQTATSLLWVAGGYRSKKFRLCLRVSRHPWLGFSNGIAISYSFKRVVDGGVEDDSK